MCERRRRVSDGFTYIGSRELFEQLPLESFTKEAWNFIGSSREWAIFWILLKEKEKEKKIEIMKQRIYRKLSVLSSFEKERKKDRLLENLQKNCKNISFVPNSFSLFVFCSFFKLTESEQFVRGLSNINIWYRCNENSTGCSESNCTHQWKQRIASAGLRGGVRLLSFRNKSKNVGGRSVSFEQFMSLRNWKISPAEECAHTYMYVKKKLI